MLIQEDFVTKLFEFVEAPQATTSELLAAEELVSYVENSCIIVQSILKKLLSTCCINTYYICLSLSDKQW